MAGYLHTDKLAILENEKFANSCFLELFLRFELQCTRIRVPVRFVRHRFGNTLYTGAVEEEGLFVFRGVCANFDFETKRRNNYERTVSKGRDTFNDSRR